MTVTRFQQSWRFNESKPRDLSVQRDKEVIRIAPLSCDQRVQLFRNCAIGASESPDSAIESAKPASDHKRSWYGKNYMITPSLALEQTVD